eukprot:CAMPEP_0202884676 /NCGR_PEP_ID=MMETSP1391-20130828/41270_1 /ASSEMBLY_ACC=CAM_ASM_000867 /TAXON_ID=1034604 /ORGANISM="Chlamydomonas leiostraca, Strain SAG 11-49" /LENGTH=200 /DNA_ID=CAMNT_0049567899 /DNA_START=537 /DNA_END=1138 /DNA_ORIENTATION=-
MNGDTHAPHHPAAPRSPITTSTQTQAVTLPREIPVPTHSTQFCVTRCSPATRAFTASAVIFGPAPTASCVLTTMLTAMHASPTPTATASLCDPLAAASADFNLASAADASHTHSLRLRVLLRWRLGGAWVRTAWAAVRCAPMTQACTLPEDARRMRAFTSVKLTGYVVQPCGAPPRPAGFYCRLSSLHGCVGDVLVPDDL